MKDVRAITLLAAVAALTLGAWSSPASATTLEVPGLTQSQAVSIEATLAAGTSLILKDRNGVTNDTCSGSTLAATTANPFTAGTLSGPVSTLQLQGCSHTTDTLSAGNLSIAWTSGTNGTVVSSGAEVTFKSTIFGVSAVCATGAGTVIGTLTGASSGTATIDFKAATLDCGALGASTWTGTYSVTSPSGFGV